MDRRRSPAAPGITRQDRVTVWRLILTPAIQFRGDGVTRAVLLAGRFAIKVPKMRYGWRLFLQGLLANMQEREFSKAGWPELCPVLFSIPGGWLVVMRRARVMTDDEWPFFDAQAWAKASGKYIIPCEFKADSFGWLDGRVVVIDYGN